MELFSDFIVRAKKNGNVFMTIPSITFEFTRTDSIDTYNSRIDFLNKYIDIYPIEKSLEFYQTIVPIIHRLKGKISYPDFLLYCCLYQFNKKALLLTENHNDFSTDILDRIDIITIDGGDKQIRNTGLYQLNLEKFDKAAKSILK